MAYCSSSSYGLQQVQRTRMRMVWVRVAWALHTSPQQNFRCRVRDPFCTASQHPTASGHGGRVRSVSRVAGRRADAPNAWGGATSREMRVCKASSRAKLEVPKEGQDKTRHDMRGQMGQRLSWAHCAGRWKRLWHSSSTSLNVDAIVEEEQSVTCIVRVGRVEEAAKHPQHEC
jgi:hypothetical protein